MTRLFILTLLLPLPFTLTAFFLSRRKEKKESALLPWVHFPAIVSWFSLMISGYGAQSLANLGEVLYLDIAAVVLAYVKIFVVDRFTERHILTTYGTVVILAASAFLLRALMPHLPE